MKNVKNVRKDVRKKLDAGLAAARKKALQTGASIPKLYKYKTPRADHFLFDDGQNKYYNTVNYDGSRCFTKI